MKAAPPIGATAPIHRGPPKASAYKAPGKEHAADEEQALRDEGDGRVHHRAAHQDDHAHHRERMDDLVVAARLQPLPRLAAGLGREVEAVRGKGADGDGDRAAQRRDDDPALRRGAHGTTAWPRLRPSAGRDAAVDHQLLAGHVVGGLGAQEQHAVGDVLRLADAGQRHHRRRALARIDRRVAACCPRAGRDLAPDRRGDDAGMHRVAADVVGGMLQRHRLGEQPHAALGRRVGGEPGRAAQARDRRHQHDRAAARAPQRRDGVLDRQEHAVEVDRLLALPVGRASWSRSAP